MYSNDDSSRIENDLPLLCLNDTVSITVRGTGDGTGNMTQGTGDIKGNLVQRTKYSTGNTVLDTGDSARNMVQADIHIG